MPLTNRAHRNAVATQCLLTLDLGPRQILLADRTHHAVSEGRGAVLLLTFLAQGSGATLRFAMVSIGTASKAANSQRGRNNCLTLEMENGARQIFWVSRDPPPCGVRGRGCRAISRSQS